MTKATPLEFGDVCTDCMHDHGSGSGEQGSGQTSECSHSCSCHPVPTDFYSIFGTTVQPFFTPPGFVISQGCHNFGA